MRTITAYEVHDHTCRAHESIFVCPACWAADRRDNGPDALGYIERDDTASELIAIADTNACAWCGAPMGHEAGYVLLDLLLGLLLVGLPTVAYLLGAR